MLARQVREQLDGLGATQTRIVVSGDLDEFSIAALRADPVDSYGVGTSLVTGSGAPTAGMVYKLVEVDGMPVEKRSSHKESQRRPQGGAAAVTPDRHDHRGGGASGGPSARHCRDRPGADHPAGPRRRGRRRHGSGAAAARQLVASGLHSLPWEGLNLAHGDPAIPDDADPGCAFPT